MYRTVSQSGRKKSTVKYVWCNCQATSEPLQADDHQFNMRPVSLLVLFFSHKQAGRFNKGCGFAKDQSEGRKKELDDNSKQ